MAQETTMRGVFPIIVTPFDEQAHVDEESLRRLVDYEIAAGVHGLGLAMGSEVFRLTEGERALVTRIIVEQARGRVPVVINTSGAGTEVAVASSREAENCGADALMLTPPIPMGMGGPATPAGVLEYFRAVSSAVHIPIFIQSQENQPVSAGLARQVAEACPQVRYIKEEVRPTPVRIADLRREAGDRLIIFGGAGGGSLIEEVQVGSVGTMPGCSQPEAFVALWGCLEAGDYEGARAHHDRIQRLGRASGLLRDGFFHVHKELLRQRGIISAAVVRGPVSPYPDDPWVRRQVQDAIDDYVAHYGRAA
ncbi:MAG: dihydrodipicolinate synthase family protein [Anaerolineae bacterium]